MSEFYDYSFLCHHGIKGMKWGVRRYQNEDGSLTSAGKERYSTSKGNIPTARPKTVTDNGTGVKKREAVKVKEKYRLRDWRSRGGSRYTPEYANFNDKIVNGGGRKGSIGTCDGIAFYANGVNLKSAKEANQYIAKYGIGLDQLYMITTIAHNRGITSLTIDPAGYTPGIYTSLFKELRGSTDTAENTDNYYTDTVFPAVNVPEQTPDFQDIIAEPNNSYKPTDVAGVLGAIAGTAVASITTPETRKAIAKGVKKVKSIIKSIKKKIKDVVDPPVTVTNTLTIAGDPNTYTDSFTMNKKKVKHSMSFNEQNYLCHYGIKGMKWGIRRYQNPDGSLTAEGIQRYGTKKNLKKSIRAEINNQKTYARETMISQKAAERAEKRTAKTAKKFEKTGKAKHLADYMAAKQSEALNKDIYKTNLEEMKEHYNKLVKEFGKESVKDINFKNGKLKEKTGDGAKIVGDLLLAGAGIITIRTGRAQLSGQVAKNDEKKMYKAYKKYEREIMKESGQSGLKFPTENRKSVMAVADQLPNMFGVEVRDKKKHHG